MDMFRADSPEATVPSKQYVTLGTHLLAEFCEIEELIKISDAPYIEKSLLAAARASGATVLSSNTHCFGEGYGVTGVVLLSESHISIHTWPEHRYAAIDIFLCGSMDPLAAIRKMEHCFSPQVVRVEEYLRGPKPKPSTSKKLAAYIKLSANTANQ